MNHMQRQYGGGSTIAVVLILAVALAACSATKSLQVTGETLKASGKQFRSVAAVYVDGCKVGRIAKDRCDQFRAFGDEFKRSFPLAVELWLIAKDANDRAATAKASEVIQQVVAQLSMFTIEAMGALSPARGK